MYLVSSSHGMSNLLEVKTRRGSFSEADTHDVHTERRRGQEMLKFCGWSLIHNLSVQGGGQKSKRNCGRYVWMAPSHSYAVHSSHLHNLPSGTKGGKGEGGCGKVGDHQDEEGSGGPS